MKKTTKKVESRWSRRLKTTLKRHRRRRRRYSTTKNCKTIYFRDLINFIVHILNSWNGSTYCKNVIFWIPETRQRTAKTLHFFEHLVSTTKPVLSWVDLLPYSLPRFLRLFDITNYGLVVMGGDSCTEGDGFESLHRILDGHFTHNCCKIFCLKGRK